MKNQKSVEVFEKLKTVKEKKGVSWYYVFKELKINQSTLYNWTKGRFAPHPLYHKKILDYVKRNTIDLA